MCVCLYALPRHYIICYVNNLFFFLKALEDMISFIIVNLKWTIDCTCRPSCFSITKKKK